MDNANLAAFPASASWNDSQPEVIQIQQEGLTKREYFAGLAMQGFAAAPEKGNFNSTEDGLKMMAELSVKAADELLNQLK